MHRRRTTTLLSLLIIIVASSFVMLNIYGRSFNAFLAGSSEAETSQGIMKDTAFLLKVLAIVAAFMALVLGALTLARAASKL